MARRVVIAWLDYSIIGNWSGDSLDCGITKLVIWNILREWNYTLWTTEGTNPLLNSLIGSILLAWYSINGRIHPDRMLEMKYREPLIRRLIMKYRKCKENMKDWSLNWKDY